MILYIHGFNSSSASFKAKVLQQQLAGSGIDFAAPDLSHWPLQAIAQLEAVIAQAKDRVTLVGSSLGGYYATWLAEKHGLKAVLINPAVVASLPFADFVGSHTNLYTGERFEFTPGHVDELRRIEVAEIRQPERFWLLVETAD